MKLKKIHTIVAASFAASLAANAATTIYSEDFETSTVTGGYGATTNAAIGDSTLYNRNGTRAFITTADGSFSNATGNVAQIGSHTAGGYALVSVPLVANLPTPITVPTLTIGDTFTISFDIFTQTIPAAGNTPSIIWNSNDGSMANQGWTEYLPGSTPGQYSVSVTHTVTAATVGVTSIGPQIQLLNGNNANAGFSTTVNEDMVQLDNILVVTSADVVPEPSSTALLGLGGLALMMRRRR